MGEFPESVPSQLRRARADNHVGAENQSDETILENDPTVRTINSLSFQARAALLNFANGKPIDRVHQDVLERKGLLELVPALTLRGAQIAQEGGWVWPHD